MDKVTELFDNFEIDREPRWPILARLAAGSFVLHLLFVASVLYVPAVRDTLNIASIFSGAQYVDADYTKTTIEDQVTVLDLAQEKFKYPEGYFSTGASDPALDPFAAQVIAEANTPPPPPPMQQLPTPTPTPFPTPTPSPSASPTPQPGANPAASPALPKGQPGEAVADKQKSREDVDKELNKIAADNNIARPDEGAINKKPLKDWLARANQMKVKGELDLSGVIEMVIEAELDPNGKLRNAKVVQKTGDPKLIELTKDFVAALSDSNALYFLKDPKFPEDTKVLRLTVKMDATEVVSRVETEARTVERAQELASGYNNMLGAAQFLRSGKDEEVLYKNTKISSNGKQVIVNFKMPRAEAGAMLSKQVPAS
ncbi:MAG: hypothetical protein WCF57_05200 [Pyrinomonadaceae bacterium]